MMQQAWVMVLALLLAAYPDAGQKKIPDVVYVGTPYDVVSRMLQLAEIKKDDKIYDLGCGDARMIVLAARKYGSRGVGYEIDPERIQAARENIRRNQVGHLVKVVSEDLFKADFSDADVLLLYLLPDINEKLLPKFEKLKPGARLVLHDYGLEGIEADRTMHVISNEDNAVHILYRYTAPITRTPGSHDAK
jgi:ribosomal protein L11 methylase PrmA